MHFTFIFSTSSQCLKTTKKSHSKKNPKYDFGYFFSKLDFGARNEKNVMPEMLILGPNRYGPGPGQGSSGAVACPLTECTPIKGIAF